MRTFKIFTLMAVCMALLVTCEKEKEQVLGNDCEKRIIEPNVVGEKMELIYAMAIPSDAGTLKSMRVEMSMPGATGTYIDPNFYRTDNSGVDVPTLVAENSSLSGNICSTTFKDGVSVATLRFYYLIPEEARDKEISFTFSVTASNGQTASYSMGPYKVSRMTIARNIVLTSGDKCYFSLENLTAYSASDLAANAALASKIDLIYNYSTEASSGHAMYSPTTPDSDLPAAGFTIPASLTNNTLIVSVFQLRDQQLANLQWAEYVTDPDFAAKDFSTGYHMMVNMRDTYGLWIESQGNVYRAFIYITRYDNAARSVTLSLKLYKV